MMRGRLRPDFGQTADDYARHRAEVPSELYDRLARGFGIGNAGQRVLDVGTGTGAVARALARRQCAATGLDPSAELLATAARLAAAEALDVRFVQGVVEATGLPAESFDVVTAAVCWHWFDAERAAAEIRRVLVPGGRLVIVHFNWLARRGNVVEATELLMRKHRPGGPGVELAERIVKSAAARVRPAWFATLGTGIHPESLSTLTSAGFEDLETFSFDADIRYDHEGWRGRVRSHAWVGASSTPHRVARFDDELAALLRQRFDGPLAIPHRVFVVVARSPQARP